MLRLWKLIFLSGIVTFAILSAISIALFTADFHWRLSGASEGLDSGPGSLIFSVSNFGGLVALTVAAVGFLGWLVTWVASRFTKTATTNLIATDIRESETSLPLVLERTLSSNPYLPPLTEVKSLASHHPSVTSLLKLGGLSAGILCFLMSLLFLLTGFDLLLGGIPSYGPRWPAATFAFVVGCILLIASVVLVRFAVKRR